MPRRKKEVVDEIEINQEYLGLDLNKIPDTLKKFEPLEYRALRSYDQKKYKQYRYININDIEILLSPVNRLTNLSEKYKKARPLYEYLDSKKEENILKHTTFLKMLKNMDIDEVKKVEKEQSNLNKNIPFKVKFEGNYLWQIYYSENTDRYFMIVPTEDTNHSTFFYLLKKKLENKKTGKIFVPITSVEYSNKILRKAEFEDIENYLWLFTKDYPSIYEVYDKKDNLSIQIIGETNIYGKVKTPYKVEIKTPEEGSEFYKLLKALFILQTELPTFYTFKTNIDENASLGLYLNEQKIEYKNMVTFIREQYKEGLKRRKELKTKIRAYNKKLKKLQEKVAMQEIEYLAKEKQISTFLECKKSFFGKFKYYFKYSKKSNKKIIDQKEENIEVEVKTKGEKQEEPRGRKKIPIKKIYTLDELITSYKELEELETEMKNLLMDINALKLKTKNMAKKIENASNYIAEIDSHKKSIFEFWKYSNKDELDVLPEGEMEEVNVIKKIEKTFDYEQDFESFGEKLDKIQRKNLSQEDTDYAYIATTNVLELLNKIKTNNFLLEDVEKNLKELKREEKQLKNLDDEEYDIFGNVIESSTRLRKINNKRHREIEKDKFQILDVNQNTKQIGYKLNLQVILQGINKALEKQVIPESLPVYMALDGEELDKKQINVFNINPETEMKEATDFGGDKINLYKINVKEGTNAIGFTNIIFYNNQNRTLPVGMNLSTKMMVDLTKAHLKLVNKTSFNIANFFDENNDFSDIEIKNVQVLEYDMVDEEDLKKRD